MSNVPTRYGYHYRNEDYEMDEIVYVFHNQAYGGVLWWKTITGKMQPVVDDGLWRGAVPSYDKMDQIRNLANVLQQLYTILYPRTIK